MSPFKVGEINRLLAPAEAAIELAKVGDLDEAVDDATCLQKDFLVSYAYSQIAPILAKSGRIIQALAMAEDITQHQDYENALYSIAKELAKQGQRTLVMQLMEKIKALISFQNPYPERNWEIVDIAVSMVHKGYPREAISIASMIGYNWLRSKVLATAAIKLVDNNDKATATTVINEAKHLLQKNKFTVAYQDSHYMEQMVIGLAQAGHSQAAIALANSTMEHLDLANALFKVCEVLDQANDTIAVERLLNEIVDIANSIDFNRFTRALILVGVVSGLAQIGFCDRAVNDIETIEWYWDRAYVIALGEVAVAATKAGDHAKAAQLFEKAITTASSMENAYERRESIESIAIALAKAGQQQKALNTIYANEKNGFTSQTMLGIAKVLDQPEETAIVKQLLDDALSKSASVQDSGTYASTSLRTVEILAQKQDWEAALSAASALVDKDQHIKALIAVANAQISAKKYIKALQLLHQIREYLQTSEIHVDSSKSLIQVASLLAQVNERETALDLLDKVSNRLNTSQKSRQIQDQEELLVPLAIALSELGKFEEALGLTTQAWLKATTKAEILARLPMVTQFISCKLTPGSAFTESFLWVDDFLKSP